MRIASSMLQMASQHSEQSSYEISSSMSSWVNERVPSGNAQLPAQGAAVPQVQLSDAGKALQSNEVAAIEKGIEDVESDPKLRMIRSLVEMLTGKAIKTLNAGAQHLDTSTTAVRQVSHSATFTATQSSSAGFGIEYTRHEEYSESEQTDFAASGVINTADGKQISFSLALSMSRSYSEQSDFSLRFGSARQMQDPLVINFDGNAAQLTDQRFDFDLDADGDKESINFVAGGSGFLALDRNGDGRINDGSELFGTRSGDGFADLSALDSDSNGWIDENDAAYAQLQVWSKDGNGNDILATLKQADVGAIALAHAATSFDLKNADNEQQGQIRSTGVFLHESGEVGTLQQVDLTV